MIKQAGVSSTVLRKRSATDIDALTDYSSSSLYSSDAGTDDKTSSGATSSLHSESSLRTTYDVRKNLPAEQVVVATNTSIPSPVTDHETESDSGEAPVDTASTRGRATQNKRTKKRKAPRHQREETSSAEVNIIRSKSWCKSVV
jgi:hypothetical protein